MELAPDHDLQIAFLKSNYEDFDKFKEYRRLQSYKSRKKGLEYIKSLKKVCFFCPSTQNLDFLHKTTLHKRYTINQMSKMSQKSINLEVSKCWCVCKCCKNKINQRLMSPLPEFWT